MGYKTLNLTLISANGLKSVNHIGEMDVYVVVSIAGAKTRTEKKTPVHRDGGSSPSWNHTLGFTFDETKTAGLWVVFKIKHHRTFGWDKVVGEVRVPVKELLGNKKAKTVTLRIRRPSWRFKGELELSFRETVPVKSKAAPAPAPARTECKRQSAYPARPPASGRPSVQHPRQNCKKNISRIGWVLAGVIGGVLLFG